MFLIRLRIFSIDINLYKGQSEILMINLWGKYVKLYILFCIMPSFCVPLQGKRLRRTTCTTATAPRAAGEASCTTTTSVSYSRSRAPGNPCACPASAARAAWIRPFPPPFHGLPRHPCPPRRQGHAFIMNAGTWTVRKSLTYRHTDHV